MTTVTLEMFLNDISHSLEIFTVRLRERIWETEKDFTLIKRGLSFKDAQRRIISTPA